MVNAFSNLQAFGSMHDMRLLFESNLRPINIVWNHLLLNTLTTKNSRRRNKVLINIMATNALALNNLQTISVNTHCSRPVL